MLWMIALSLWVLWGLAVATSHTLGGYIHILLVVAALVAAIRVIKGPPSVV
jgi:hypothetical protein